MTGERVFTDLGGFNPTFQRTRAAYGLAADLLDRGITLDLGCGTGHSFHLLGRTIGVDRSFDALLGQTRPLVVCDMRWLPFRRASFDAVASIQSVEHVPDPERILTDAAWVLQPGRASVFVTPNRLTFGRPDEIIDPYHYVEWSPDEFEQFCRTAFDDVRVYGVFASDRYDRIWEREHARLDRYLRLDRFRLRRLAPRRLRQVLYDRLLQRNRSRVDEEAATISVDDFRLGEDDLDRCHDLVAVCRRTAR